MNYKERLVIDMDLKVGDIVEFKNYENMTDDENMWINRDNFPKSGKIALIENNGLFIIEGCEYIFNPGSVARVISDVYDIDINSLKPGDEVLVKANVNEVFEDHVYVASKIYKKSVVKILKRKEPERFIVKEGHYGMYVNGSGVLIADKRHAKIYNSRNEANDEAADMHLNAWDVIPYDD